MSQPKGEWEDEKAATACCNRAFVVCAAENMTIMVGKGEGYLESIQEAINQANDGDIIYIKDGVYSENLVIKDKTLKIMGESPNVKITEEIEASPVIYKKIQNLNLPI